ncbi:hypothetical protein AXF42_Ash001951 [Apostasia shenzhenica]|uniref:Uncharacterized protein n=1 Tax=Apostasia shenzhenica TaxID=1088818 RepID=A0A2I0ABP4_9ASPA|nr:hypothetical protein AXF42_Ash001951 [Apostasia shenzhenica]
MARSSIPAGRLRDATAAFVASSAAHYESRPDTLCTRPLASAAALHRRHPLLQYVHVLLLRSNFKMSLMHENHSSTEKAIESSSKGCGSYFNSRRSNTKSRC